MNYINSSVSHWFVFCEALYLYRLLRENVRKEYVRGYIITGWGKCELRIQKLSMILSELFSGTIDSNEYNLYNTIFSQKRFAYMLV